MAVYVLVKNATATQTAFGALTPVSSPSQIVAPTGPDNPNSPPQSLGVSVELTSTVASASAALVVMASNDVGDGHGNPANPQWFDIGCTVTASGSIGAAAAGTIVNAPYKYFTGYIKTLTGTSTSATGLISA